MPNRAQMRGSRDFCTPAAPFLPVGQAATGGYYQPDRVTATGSNSLDRPDSIE